MRGCNSSYKKYFSLPLTKSPREGRLRGMGSIPYLTYLFLPIDKIILTITYWKNRIPS
jgi:hypothetical protein